MISYIYAFSFLCLALSHAIVCFVQIFSMIHVRSSGLLQLDVSNLLCLQSCSTSIDLLISEHKQLLYIVGVNYCAQSPRICYFGHNMLVPTTEMEVNILPFGSHVTCVNNDVICYFIATVSLPQLLSFKIHFKPKYQMEFHFQNLENLYHTCQTSWSS